MAKRVELGNIVVAEAGKQCKRHQKKEYLPPAAWRHWTGDRDELETARGVRYKFECPICYLVQYPSSHTCPMGHVVCFPCFRMMKKVAKTRICPMCRSSPIKQHSTPLLNHTFKFDAVTCRYQDAGCRVLVRLANLGQHEAHCARKPVYCVYPGCRWTDSVCDNLREHVSGKHPDTIVKAAASTYTIEQLQLVRFVKFRKIAMVKAPDNSLVWLILTTTAANKRCRIGAVKTRSNPMNLSHDFEPTGQKFVVRFTDGQCDFVESRHVLWDTTLVNGDNYLNMKRFVPIPYCRTTRVSISILPNTQ